jgi:pyruvate formate lyase activating enzyme
MMTHPAAVLVNIQRFSTEDGPGIRSTVFFKGCPMRCPWCHNPETMRFEPEVVWHRGRCLGDHRCVEVCPASAIAATENGIAVDHRLCTGCGECADFCPSEAIEIHGRKTPVTAILERLQRDAAFYQVSGGGVTLSGGEPLAQPDAAIALLRLLKDAGLHTALDTCGAASQRVLEEALEAVDLVLFDIKTTDLARHERFTGVPFRRVAASARIVNRAGLPVWVRTPIIPGYTDDEEALRSVARFVRDTFDRCERHDLLAFSNLCRTKYDQLGRTFALAGAPLVDADTMKRLSDAARDEGSPNVHWSGPTRIGESAA